MTDRTITDTALAQSAAISQSLADLDAAEIKRNEARDEAERAADQRRAAQHAFVAAHRNLAWALNQECKAVAAEAAANGVPLAKFLAGAVTNARTASPTWSGGAHSADNVVEALRRESWLDLADDASTPSLFNRTGA